MRAPLLVLIGAYAVAILGFVLIPGVDDAGRPWRMDFFHALYFVSYMSTTIGFGELPHPFADHLAIALHSPGLYLLQDWITGVPHSALAEPLYPPRGTWILCGYGRFGKAVRRYLEYEGIPTRIIEALPDLTDSPEGTVAGKGTEAVTPREANIQSAVGLVAGTDNDADNLSIIMTALELKPDLFVVARQNKRQHDRLFQAVESQLVMQPARIIVRRILALISTPLTAGAVDQPQVRQAPRPGPPAPGRLGQCPGQPHRRGGGRPGAGYLGGGDRPRRGAGGGGGHPGRDERAAGRSAGRSP
jgi:hypothetical protein